jgi:hypothetical protein
VNGSLCPSTRGGVASNMLHAAFPPLGKRAAQRAPRYGPDGSSRADRESHWAFPSSEKEIATKKHDGEAQQARDLGVPRPRSIDRGDQIRTGQKRRGAGRNTTEEPSVLPASSSTSLPMPNGRETAVSRGAFREIADPPVVRLRGHYGAARATTSFISKVGSAPAARNIKTPRGVSTLRR